MTLHKAMRNHLRHHNAIERGSDVMPVVRRGVSYTNFEAWVCAMSALTGLSKDFLVMVYHDICQNELDKILKNIKNLDTALFDNSITTRQLKLI